MNTIRLEVFESVCNRIVQCKNEYRPISVFLAKPIRCVSITPFVHLLDLAFCPVALFPELSMDWVDPWVALGWVGLGRDF